MVDKRAQKRICQSNICRVCLTGIVQKHDVKAISESVICIWKAVGIQKTGENELGIGERMA